MKILEQFEQYLKGRKYARSTVEVYVSRVNEFIRWCNQGGYIGSA